MEGQLGSPTGRLALLGSGYCVIGYWPEGSKTFSSESLHSRQYPVPATQHPRGGAQRIDAHSPVCNMTGIPTGCIQLSTQRPGLSDPRRRGRVRESTVLDQ